MTTEPTILPANQSLPGRAYKRRVRNIIIHKPMQREFTFVLISLLMISSLAIGFVIHHTIHAAVFSGFRFGKVSPYEVLSDVSYQLIIRVSCVLFVTLIVIGMFGLLFLHRIAGPVYRFRQVFMAINRGDVPKLIKLREGDFFEETAEEINLVLKRMEFEKQKLERVRDKLTAILGSKLTGSLENDVKTLKVICEEAFDKNKLKENRPNKASI